MMTRRRHSDQHATPTPGEVEAVAAALEARHGVHAAEVADFFSALHGRHGDTGRCWAWAGVAEVVRQRQRERLSAIGWRAERPDQRPT
jgi:hypothetical protein